MTRLFYAASTLAVATASAFLLAATSPSKYLINDRVLVPTPDGATISAIVVRPRGAPVRRPAALEFTIYADGAKDVKYMEYAADRGYAGVVAYTRGKAYSPQRIIPYEDDGRDADAVIAWIAKQPWSDGRVGMFGGSYDGFTQWAAAKHPPAALKTIVPYVANNPGNGLPMQNGIPLLVNYPWIYYVTDKKFADQAAYADPKFRGLAFRWYNSGRAYRDVPRIAGTPNPWLQKWLSHPSYDAYWQAMVPYRGDFARITIPVLTITGYWDDGQISALGFYKDHYRYNPQANDYLVIGPWDHLGTQHRVKDAILRGYRIDPVAQINTPKLTFDWLDYVMRGKPRPALVRDRVNYEVMGANVWRHAPSLSAMGSARTYYLTSAKVSRRFYLLSPQTPEKAGILAQRVDFADRKTSNNDSYPDPILGKKPNLSNGYAFVTQPFTEPVTASGFDAVIRATVNKRDMDVGIVLYEMLPDGRLMQLSYSTVRASYARDLSRRLLLTPGRPVSIPFDQTTLFSRVLPKGSRLMLTLNVNKNPFAEINYGTGRDVATEDVRDAKTPLRVQWLTTSFIRVFTSSSSRRE